MAHESGLKFRRGDSDEDDDEAIERAPNKSIIEEMKRAPDNIDTEETEFPKSPLRKKPAKGDPEKIQEELQKMKLFPKSLLVHKIS